MKHNKLLLLFILACATLIISTATSFAQESRGLIISPRRVVFEDRERSKELLVANRSSQKAKYRISVINRKMDENGQLQPADSPADNEFFAKNYIRYAPRQVTLGPKETQKIRVMSRFPADADAGEYRSHLLIQEVPDAKAAENAQENESADGLGININAIYGISLPVIMRKGKLDYNVTLKNPKFRTQNGEKYVDVSLERSGNKSIFGTAKVLAGAAEIGILKGIAIYLSSSRRKISIKLDPERARNLSGQTLRLTFGSEESNEDAPSAEITFKVP